jgi:hypothetical protein
MITATPAKSRQAEGLFLPCVWRRGCARESAANPKPNEVGRDCSVEPPSAARRVDVQPPQPLATHWDHEPESPSRIQSARGLAQSRTLARVWEGLPIARQRFGLRQSSAAFRTATEDPTNNDGSSMRFMGKASTSLRLRIVAMNRLQRTITQLRNSVIILEHGSRVASTSNSRSASGP